MVNDVIAKRHTVILALLPPWIASFQESTHMGKRYNCNIVLFSSLMLWLQCLFVLVPYVTTAISFFVPVPYASSHYHHTLTLCIIILQARHDHNKIAPCGMIKVFFFFKLNWIILLLHQHTRELIRARKTSFKHNNNNNNNNKKTYNNFFLACVWNRMYINSTRRISVYLVFTRIPDEGYRRRLRSLVFVWRLSGANLFCFTLSRFLCQRLEGTFLRKLNFSCA